MKETFAHADELSCADAAALLEHRFVEGPLLRQAEQRLCAHLASCRQCRRLEDWMSALKVQAAAHGEARFHARLRSAYQILADKRDRGQRRERRIKIAIAVVAAALPLVVMLSRSLPAVHNASQAAVQSTACRPALPGELAPGVLMTHCDEEVIDTLVEDDGEVRVRLAGGTVGMLIDPNRPNKRKVVVETPQGEVRVKGTLFTVQVDARRSLLEVFRGVVEFVPSTSAGPELSVKAGQGADLGRQTVFALSAPTTASIKQVLYDAAGRLSTARAPSPADRSIALKSGEATVALGHGEPAASMRASADERKTSVTQRSDTKPRAASTSKRDVPGIDSLIHEAQACLIARDWACASSRYEGLLTHYPSSPESTAALVSLARIELSHLRRPMRALGHLKAYQERAPNGPMAEEALFGIAVTFRRLGNKDRERSTLHQFIEQYPNSSQVRRARIRLRQLEPNE